MHIKIYTNSLPIKRKIQHVLFKIYTALSCIHTQKKVISNLHIRQIIIMPGITANFITINNQYFLSFINHVIFV